MMKFARTSRAGDESGMALIAVIGIMALGLIITSALLGTVNGGFGYSTMTKASVQSEASSEAGVSVARAAVTGGTCDATAGHLQSAVGAVPQYDVQVWYLSGSSTWIQGCPPSGSTTMKVVSAGTSQAAAVNGAKAGNKTNTTVVYSAPVATATVVTSGQAIYSYGSVAATGAGLVTAVNNSTANVYVANGSLSCDGGAGIAGDVVVPNGDVSITGGCKVGGSIYTSGALTLSGGTPIAGNIVAKTLNFSGSGPITGSVWATGTASSTINSSFDISGSVYAAGPLTMSSGSVAGNLIAAGTLNTSAAVAGNVVSGATLNITGGSVNASAFAAGTVADQAVVQGNIVSTAGDVSFSGGAKVNGSVWATAGTLTTSWGQDIGGGASAKNINFNGGKVGTKAYAKGVATLNADAAFQIYAGSKAGSNAANPAVIIWNGTSPAAPTVPGTPVALSAPTSPTVAPWIDVTFVASSWSGFTVLTVSGSACTTKDIYPLITSLGSTKGVIDARGCGSVDLSSGYNYGANNSNYQSPDFTLQNDLVILTKKFAMSNGSFTSSTAHKLWFIQEDTTANQQPTCNGQSFSFGGGGLTISSNLSLMIYTPCSVTLTSSQSIYGQIYSAGSTLSGAGKISFAAVGIPGWNLDTGSSSVSSNANRTWTASSFTNTSAG